MQPSFLEEQSISMCSCSAIESRSIEVAVAGDKEADMCEHFTIRGYVADVRKKNPKICCPFSTHHNGAPSEELMLLPPLSVTRFRQWNCQKCCRGIVPSAAKIANGGLMDAPNDEVKTDNCLLLHNASPGSHHNATKFISSLSQPCAENAIEGRSNNASCSNGVCNSENHSSPCGGKNENESAIAVDLTKEDEHNTSEEKQKQPNDFDYIAVEGEKIETEEPTDCMLLQNSLTASQHSATKSISGLSQPYIENTTEGRSKDTNCSTDICDFEAAIETEPTKEGWQIYREEHNTSEESQNKSNEFDYIAVEGENNGTGEIGEENTVVTTKAYETSHHETDPDMVSPTENEMKSNCEIDSSELCGNLNSRSTNMAYFGLGDDQGVSRIGKIEEPYDVLCGGSRMPVAAHMSDHNSVSLEDNQQASESDIITTNIMWQNQNNANKQEKLYENMKHKKIRKVRLLNDIMRHDDLCMPGQVRIFEVDVKSIDNTNEKMTCTSRGEAQNPEQGRQLVDRKTEVNLSKIKNRNNAIQNTDAHHFPMQWLRQMPTKRSVTRKGDGETKRKSISKPEVDTSVGKDLIHRIDVDEVRKHKREAIVGRKKCMLPQMKAGRHLISLQQDIGTGKGSAHKYLPNDHIQKKYVQSSNTITVNEKILHQKRRKKRATQCTRLPPLWGTGEGQKILHHELKIQDTTRQKDIFHNKKRRAHKMDVEQFNRMYLPKGKVTKKRRTMRTWDKGSIDGIPIDIVELLAKNLHEKRMMNADHATKSTGNLSQVTDNLNGAGVTSVAKCLVNTGPQFVYDKLIQKKMRADIVRNGVCATSTSHENSYNLPEAYRSSTIGDHDNDDFPNQQKMYGPSTSFSVFSHTNKFSMVEVLPVTSQYEKSFQQNLCSSRMQSSGYNRTCQVISDRNSGRKIYDASGLLSNEGTSGINRRKIDPILNHVNRDSNNTSLKRDPNTSIHSTDWKRSSNPAAKQPLAHEWKDESSIHRGTPAATTSGLQIGNEGHSKATWPADQHTIRNTWALNFPAVWSDGYFHASSNINSVGFVQESEMYFKDGQTVLLGSGVGVKSTETIEHQGNSCKPVRPVPRIGTLGPVLQQEISNRSGNFRPQPVIKDGCSSQMVCPNIIAISRAECSKWTVPNIVSTSLGFSRTSNGMGRVEFRNKDGWHQPPSSSVSMEICVINRNPADFTLPDETNEYMRGKEGLRFDNLPFSKSQKRQATREKLKQQKVKKLGA